MNPRHLLTDITELIDYVSVNYIRRKSFKKFESFEKSFQNNKKNVQKKSKKMSEKI